MNGVLARTTHAAGDSYFGFEMPKSLSRNDPVVAVTAEVLGMTLDTPQLLGVLDEPREFSAVVDGRIRGTFSAHLVHDPDDDVVKSGEPFDMEDGRFSVDHASPTFVGFQDPWDVR